MDRSVGRSAVRPVVLRPNPQIPLRRLVDGQDRALNALRGDPVQLTVPPDAKFAVDVEVEGTVGVASKDRRIFGDRRELIVAIPDEVA